MQQCELKCNICGLIFSGDYELNVHIKTHRLPCSQCGVIFYRQNNLNYHIRHVHDKVPWLPPQFGGGHEKIAFSGKHFDVITRRTRRNRLGLKETTYSVRFRNLKPNVDDTLTQRMVYLKKMIYKIILVFKAKMTQADTAQLILYGDPNNIKSTFSTPFLGKSDFTYAYVSYRVAELLNSNENFRINNEMFIDVKVISASGGRGTSLKNVPNLVEVLIKKNVCSRIREIIISVILEH